MTKARASDTHMKASCTGVSGPKGLFENVYGFILQRRKPGILQNTTKKHLEYHLDDLLGDMRFREWLLNSIQDNSIVVREPDMLLVPALEALQVGWLSQSRDYLWALDNYPELVDRLATLGLAILYNESGKEVS